MRGIVQTSGARPTRKTPHIPIRALPYTQHRPNALSTTRKMLYLACGSASISVYYHTTRAIGGMQHGIRVIGISLIAWLLVAEPAPAQDARALTLEESVERALARHGLLQRAQAQAAEARAGKQEAQAAWWPSLTTEASYVRLDDRIPPVEGQVPGADETFEIAPIEFNHFRSEIRLEQMLFTGLRRMGQIRAAEARVDAAGAAVADQRAAVALEVREAYWTLAREHSRVEAADQSLVHVRAHRRNVQAQFEAGAALEHQVLAAEARVAQAQLDRVEATNAVRTARTTLNQLIGEAPHTPVTLVTEVETGGPAAPPGDSLDDHPQLTALRQDVAARKAEAGMASRAWLPDLALTARYLFARPNPNFFFERDRFRGNWEAGVTMRWTVWDGGRRSAAADGARARLRAAEAQLAHTQRELTQRIARDQLAVEGARAAVDAAEHALRQAHAAFEMAQEQFTQGGVLSSEVLEAEAALFRARQRTTEALTGYARAEAALLYARGRVW